MWKMPDQDKTYYVNLIDEFWPSEGDRFDSQKLVNQNTSMALVVQQLKGNNSEMSG